MTTEETVAQKNITKPISDDANIKITASFDAGKIGDFPSINALQTNIIGIRSDLDKLKMQIDNKVSKQVITELEGKIIQHTKSLDVMAKKMMDMQSNLREFSQQPISHTLIDTIKKQLTDEIMEKVLGSITESNEKLQKSFDEKITEIKNTMALTKRAFFVQKK